MATSKTPKELAEATAATALESLIAQLNAETLLRVKLREALTRGAAEAPAVERLVFDAAQRSDAAFDTWRTAQKAIPYERSST